MTIVIIAVTSKMQYELASGRGNLGTFRDTAEYLNISIATKGLTLPFINAE